jgi:AraC-like DNA-binding protein
MNIPAFVEVNHSAMVLTCTYAAIALWPFFKKKKKATRRPQGNGSGYAIPFLSNLFFKKDDKADKLSRYFSDENKIAKVDVAISKLLASKKPFLSKKYSVSDLAAEVNVPVLYLSGFINRYYKMNFNELINRYRVSHFKTMIRNGEWKNKKLSAIASESGFNNRNTFTASFKRETGKTPSEYVKAVKNDRESNRSLFNDLKKRKIV